MAETPSLERTPSYIEMTPKRSIASFDNLVALANYQERLHEARKMVWRDRGEPVTEVQDLWECLEHAGRGGLRAGALAFNIRVGVNLVLLIFRIRNAPSKLRMSLVRHAIFGEDSMRFAAMLGSFVAIYKFLLNALPILLPHDQRRHRSAFSDYALELDEDLEAGKSSPEPLTTRRHARDHQTRLSLSIHAQEALVRKKTRRWYAAAAGAIAGGLAIMFEKRSRRVTIAQQMFVRGLQGSYNAFTTKRGIRIPHGEAIVFALACGQIMYGFILRPDTLPRSYSTWIGNASKVPVEAVKMNRDIVREGRFSMADLETILNRENLTPHNRTILQAIHDNPLSYPRPFGPCEAIHPTIDSCAVVPFRRFFDVFAWMLPVYGALHFIPMILFKRKLFMRDPKRMLLRAGWGTTRSSAFLGVFVIIYQTAFCFKHNLHRYLSDQQRLKLPQWVIDILVSRPSFWVLGLMTGLSLFVEERRRRGELAMYVLPKGLESLWTMARGKGLVKKPGKLGEPLLTAVGMAMVMSTYQNDPQHLSGLVRRILYQFVGPN